MFLLYWLVGCSGPKDDSGPKDSETIADTGTPQLVIPALVVNEFMADNDATIDDPNGEASDWIELHNAGTLDVSLEGYTITDDLLDPGKHELPGLTVPAGGFLLLWADADGAGDAFVGFSLEQNGEEIGLYMPDGFALDLLNYVHQESDLSACRYPDGNEGADAWFISDTPTPGSPNAGAP